MFRPFFLLTLSLIFVFRLLLSCDTGSNNMIQDLSTCDKKSSHLKLPFLTYLSSYRTLIQRKSQYIIAANFDSPTSELVLGMVMGIDNFSRIPDFKNALKRSGTIHVVVVSGFNITLVFQFIEKLFKTMYKTRYLILAQLIITIYAFLTGFEAPVVRALLMSSIYIWFKYNGVATKTLSILIFSILLMLIINPLYIFSLSFHLSVGATSGLILFSKAIENFISKFLNTKSILVQDFISTISAQIFVFPILAYFFGELSLISFLVNTIILWTVPLITVLGSITLLVGIFMTKVPIIPSIVSVLSYIFTLVVNTASKFNFATIDFTMDIYSFVLYYLVVIMLSYKVSRKGS